MSLERQAPGAAKHLPSSQDDMGMGSGKEGRAILQADKSPFAIPLLRGKAGPRFHTFILKLINSNRSYVIRLTVRLDFFLHPKNPTVLVKLDVVMLQFSKFS
jgi:hypothetical protein